MLCPALCFGSLAVHPDSQNKGLGRALVTATFSTAQQLGLDDSRSLIKEDNRPSQRCFSSVDYSCDTPCYEMLFWPPDKSAATEEHITPSPLSIDTLTYRGIWIGDLEKLDQQQQLSAVAHARACCAEQNRDSASTLLKRDAILHAELRSTARSNGFYQWWQRAL